MPTPAQVANREQRPPRERHRVGTVTATGPPHKVALDPGGAVVSAVAFTGTTHPVNARVLVVLTAAGNWILGRIA
jgi:hypothetical protein